MMEQYLFILNEAALPSAVSSFLTKIGDARKIAISGEMGAGKTTFIKTLCKTLGVLENVSSPTFSLVNEYHTQSGTGIYHIDLYRLKNLQEALDIGIEDYIYHPSNYCFIEWPELIEKLLQSDFIHIRIENDGNSARKIIFL